MFLPCAVFRPEQARRAVSNPGCVHLLCTATIHSMLGIDRKTAHVAWTVILIFVLVAIVYLIRETLLIFTVALLLAYLLWPLVEFFDRRLPGRSRTPALAIVYLALVALLIVIGVEVGSRVIDEANAFASRLPDLLVRLQRFTAVPPTDHSIKATVLSAIRKQVVDHSRDLLALLPEAGLKVVSAAGRAVFIVLVPILSFFFLKDGSGIRKSLLEVFAAGEQRRRMRELAGDLHILLAQYMRALVLLAASAFVAYGAFLSLVGAPYALLLAVIAFPLEFIPLVGPMTAAAVILVVAALSGFHHLVWILIFVIIFRLFQDYFVQPHVMSAGMELHPLLVIFGVLAGAQLGGVAGAFLSVPALATLRIVYRRLIRRTTVVPAAQGVTSGVRDL